MALDYDEFIAKLEVEDKELDKTEMKISEIPFQTEEMKTLEEFWENFIAKRLPDTKVAIAWHKLLMNYVDEDKVKNPVFLLRYGAQEGRRGLLTQTTKNYSFVYADNEPAACHYKLIMRGCVPTLEALTETYQKRNFPPTAYQNKVKDNFEKNFRSVPNIEIPQAYLYGCKLAHIFDVGKNYYSDSRYVKEFKTIVDENFNFGRENDWKEVTDESTGEKYYLRQNFSIDDNVRKWIVAEFLRFVHPFNYFLVPNKDCVISTLLKKDIGEEPLLLNFVSKKIREYYSADKENDGEKCYTEFLEKILLIPDIPTGEMTIDLEYKSSPQIKGLKKTKTPSQKTNLEQNEKAPKALAKIEKWSKVDSNISKVIRAFFAVEENGFASYSAMEKFCIEKFEMSAKSFKNKCSQLMCEKDTSDDGKVFDKNGDDVTVWKPIKEKLYKHFQ